MRYSSEPAVYTTHVRGNAPLNPPPMNASRPEGSQATDAVRAAVAADRASARNSVVEAAAAFRADLAAAAERRQQFNGSGMRSVGPDIELNPDRGAAVAESAAGAAMVNPDAGYTELPAVAGPPYQPEEGEEEEKAEGPQQEAKSPGRFRRFRESMRGLMVSPSARVVPVAAEHAIRHRREIERAFAPADRGVFASGAMLEEDVPMAALSSSRDLLAGAREQRYNETLQWMQGKSAFDLPKTTVTAVARGLGITVRNTMSKEDISTAVQQVLDRQSK